MRKISLFLIVVVCMFSSVALMTGCDGDSNNDDEPSDGHNNIVGLWLLTPVDSSISELSDDWWKPMADEDIFRLTNPPLYANIHSNVAPDYGVFMEEFITSLGSDYPLYTGSTKGKHETIMSEHYDFVFDLNADTCYVKYNVYVNDIMAYQISVLYDIDLGQD